MGFGRSNKDETDVARPDGMSRHNSRQGLNQGLEPAGTNGQFVGDAIVMIFAPAKPELASQRPDIRHTKHKYPAPSHGEERFQKASSPVIESISPKLRISNKPSSTKPNNLENFTTKPTP
ncbi:hypothetical protein CIHG_01567 [Coccidioides immitis H538.4]|uniref:Uncharacterized protein n=2 Tax=Coccidioides immitis TaxID=5501 RepID=A0A0J8QVT4_COCIT|nr:hypothetical protein CISG_05073 [Coccidioides immitis RMSCC 3703]KMU83784.1 hypothetical protein CIHG_01567 [Coccidioides immitis H538.4]